MSEKEEITQDNRIINAEKYKRRIKKSRIYIDVRDKKLNCLLSKVYTRQEAIERMAKALCKYDIGGAVGCERCKFAKDKEKCEDWIAFNHSKNAEVAVDALLSL